MQLNRAHEVVHYVSEDAQAKLGMPLAWLEDVTPADWKVRSWRARVNSLLTITYSASTT